MENTMAGLSKVSDMEKGHFIFVTDLAMKVTGKRI